MIVGKYTGRASWPDISICSKVHKKAMLNIFNWKPKYPDLGWMSVDIHSHILPGIDDGCENLKESVELLKRLENLGLKKFFFTPHIMSEIYPNTMETISNKYEQLKTVKEAAHLMSGFAAEYMVDTSFDKMLNNEPEKILALPGNYVLLELSYLEESKLIEKAVFDLKIKGFFPILAHPERYLYYHKNPQKIQRLKEIGCLLQLNLLSIFSYYGKNESRMANFLIEKGWINLLGTDSHHTRHVKALELGLQRRDILNQFKKCTILNEELFAKIPT